MERLFTPKKPWEAHLLRGLLEQAGLAVQVVDVPAEGVGPMEVWVQDASDPVAREVLQKYLERRAAPDPGERYCKNCKEKNPANFEVCWNCQREIK